MAFQARYEGRCAGNCGQRIKVGDEVVFVDDQLVHNYCIDEKPAVMIGGRVTSTCLKCQLVHRGECF